MMSCFKDIRSTDIGSIQEMAATGSSRQIAAEVSKWEPNDTAEGAVRCMSLKNVSIKQMKMSEFVSVLMNTWMSNSCLGGFFWITEENYDCHSSYWFYLHCLSNILDVA